MYKLKNVAKRGSALLGAVGLLAGVGTSAIPALASADALNPLTERSLTLSSSSPGWSFTDGSGNAFDAYPYSPYSVPNSGTNGRNSGNYYSFKVSSTHDINAMTFQYCIHAAGVCSAPGDNAYTGTNDNWERGVDTTTTSDLNVVSSSPSEISQSTWGKVNVAGAGTITTTADSDTVSGTDTTFGTDVQVGDKITTAGGHTYTVSAIDTDNQKLTLTTGTGVVAEADATFTYSTPGTLAYNVAKDTSDTDHTGQAWTGGSAPSGHSDTTNQHTIANGSQVPAPDNSEGNFVVLVNGAYSGGWTMTIGNQEESSGHTTEDVEHANNDSTDDNANTGKNNLITLANNGNSGAGISLTAGDKVEVKFYATATNYITNPGSGSFFVKINDYAAPHDATTPFAISDPTTINPVDHVNSETGVNENIIDGGVTVANVMNESISIQTKVLETMDFSVGTVDPDTLSSTQLAAAGKSIGGCNTILPSINGSLPHNILTLGDPTNENALDTNHTFATHSYFRLSSNSSNGATVYYSGSTLSNTEGDQIDPIGVTATQPSVGTEQFGLALDHDGSADHYYVDYGLAPQGASTVYEMGADTISGNQASGYTKNTITSSGQLDDGKTEDGSGLSQEWQQYLTANDSFHNPQLYPLTPAANYTGGNGGINNFADPDAGGPLVGDTISSSYAFDPSSNTVPVALAADSSQVVDCITGKVRYIANIAATTPAGIYTTKINYIAAPEY